MYNRKKLIKVLSRLVQADYTDVKKLFLKQNAHSQEINEYFELFKELKKRDKIKNKDEKNIDLWGKKTFQEFKNFVDKLTETRTKSQEKRLKKMEGAELVAQNDDYYIYRITTHDAVMAYGSGTKWCITQPNGKYWQQYSARNDFYFFIAKNKSKDDPLYKVAMTINSKGKETYWDALDQQKDTPPTQIDYEFKAKEIEVGVKGIFQRLADERQHYEDYYSTTEAYENEAEYFEIKRGNIGNRLSDHAEKLIKELEDLVPDDDTLKHILIDCSDLSLEDMYYAYNEVLSFSVGTQEPSIDDDIQEDIETLTDAEKEELAELCEKGDVYIDKRFGYYLEVGDYYNRLVGILDEYRLEQTLKELREEKEREEAEEEEEEEEGIK